MDRVRTNEAKREKARNLRHKKPLVRNLNLDAILEELWNIREQCDNVRWFVDTDEETLINALDGNEDEAYEFRMMFADLSADCEKMYTDLKEEWVPDCFDRFFVAVGAGDDYGGLIGYDAYEQDYFGMSPYLDALAESGSAKILKRMTKDDLIVAARQCFRVYQSFIGLSYRYDCLEAAIDILRDQNTGYLQMVKNIEEMYEKAEKESQGFRYDLGNGEETLDKLLANMPQEAWIQ